jgi:AbrB family looped-hinge helix DNA binding protein
MEMKRTYIIQDNGQVTLPREWRQKYGLKKGDLVSFVETDEGLLVLPREVVAMDALDRIAKTLTDKGIQLDELIEDGRDIRGEIYREKYAQASPDD